ncbi:hypothetical protein HK099_007402 [Clydaea vesicula]|uniref:Uncharacterized protein n=1 Tax=Clydaea vesicula TaxID=447962 RepID=A0AAD5TZ24_9FUNG|nr:hypothetical protein HK099_007402 [Clydaea vesicula]KAJ3386150.1 hypothetical protein HDU92_002657 [Lobulomyces angularis]
MNPLRSEQKKRTNTNSKEGNMKEPTWSSFFSPIPQIPNTSSKSSRQSSAVASQLSHQLGRDKTGSNSKLQHNDHRRLQKPEDFEEATTIGRNKNDNGYESSLIITKLNSNNNLKIQNFNDTISKKLVKVDSVSSGSSKLFYKIGIHQYYPSEVSKLWTKLHQKPKLMVRNPDLNEEERRIHLGKLRFESENYRSLNGSHGLLLQFIGLLLFFSFLFIFLDAIAKEFSNYNGLIEIFSETQEVLMKNLNQFNIQDVKNELEKFIY